MNAAIMSEPTMYVYPMVAFDPNDETTPTFGDDAAAALDPDVDPALLVDPTSPDELDALLAAIPFVPVPEPEPEPDAPPAAATPWEPLLEVPVPEIATPGPAAVLGF